MDNKIIDFWENCNPNFSHIEISGHLKDFKTLTSSWENNFLNEYDFTNKCIIDYGIGGGYLGLYLFQNKSLNKYIGFDISNRQLNQARKNLKGYNCEFYNSNIDKKFNKYDANILICQAVIQHFPNEEYLIDYLNNVNDSGVEDVMLQIRYSDDTKFNEGYDNMESVRLACQTNSDYILKRMVNYDLNKSKKLDNNSNYEFLFFKLKK